MMQRTEVRKVWPSRGSRTAHQVFASWAVVGAAVLASRYMAVVQHRNDVQAFHRAGRERGGRPCHGRRKAAAWWRGTARRCSRSTGFTASASLRSSSGFHDARGRSTTPGRRGPVFPRLVRLPPPRTAARGGSGMDSAALRDGGSGSSVRSTLPSILLSPSPLLL
jgi:hypothetical protein